MSRRRFATLLSTACVVALLMASLSVTTPRTARAGISSSVMALVGPLAQQFGVPADAISSLLEGGLSLDSVTQLLLVSQSGKAMLSDVASRYQAVGNDIDATAKQFDVAKEAYSPEKVSAALDQARATAEADASRKASDEANKAVGSALGGLGR